MLAAHNGNSQLTSDADFLPPFFLFLGAIFSVWWKGGECGVVARGSNRLGVFVFFSAAKKIPKSGQTKKTQANSLAPLGKRKGSVLYGKIVSVFGKYNHHFSLFTSTIKTPKFSRRRHRHIAMSPLRPLARGFASAVAKPLRKGAQPPASQPLVLLGVCLGLAVAAGPLAFKSVRQREQSVAEMRDAQYSGDGKDAARDDRLKGRKRRTKEP